VTAEKNNFRDGTGGAPLRHERGSKLGVRSQPIQLGKLQSDDANEDADPVRAIMLLAQQGDSQAFRELVEMFQNRVMRVMVSVLRCDRATAEDLCQEVFLRVYKGLSGFDGKVRFAAWLHTISTNVAISEYRRGRAQKRDRPTISIDAPLGGTEDVYISPVGNERQPTDVAQQHEFLAKVRSCVQELPDEYREAVVLRDMESLSYEEIAIALKLPTGTVRSRIHRGRLLLQQKLQEFRP
jgi:RNA polymerase sigma-70 factor, ECF subfamily